MTARATSFVTAERWNILEPLLDAALNVPPLQRRAFLAEACTGDDAMRVELEEMLADCERESPLLDRPAADRFTSLSSDVDVAALGASLNGRYTLEREIGRGGMAVVFLAHDLKHQRRVAIKVLEPHAAAPLSVERFSREIVIAARLAHPHILALYDSGRAGDAPYYVMPHVPGPSLRERIRTEGALALDEAVRIAGQIAAALDYAHREGVIHRDIKPDNVLLLDGAALVADFGIARAMSRASQGGEHVTAAGVGLGTPAYMSPEQVTRPDAIDGRADIYAVGCVLFEMLTGQPPFAGPTQASVIAQHVGAPIPSARALRATVTPALDAVVQRALAKNPVDRFATGAQLCDALVQSTALATPSGGVMPPESASIAVLPFVNLSPDAENEYFSDGVTEELINALATVPALNVASRSSSFAFKGQPLGAAVIARQLGVRTVLEGSLRRAGNRIRITVQLISAADGYTLWSERYDREVHDVFDIQEDIARTIVDTLRVRLTNAQDGSLGKRRTENLEAYELYLRGRHCWFRRGMLTRSMGYFERALEADPDYALAHHGLADGYAVLALYAFAPPAPVIARATQAVARAVALAPELAEVRTSEGFVQLLQWNWAAADDAFREALRLNPRYALAHSFHAWLLTTVGRQDDAAAAARRGQELDPLSSATNGIAALVLYHGRAYDQSIRECERALEIEPGSFLALLAITLSYAAGGHHAMALQYAREGVRLSPDSLFLRGLLGAVCGMSGLAAEARDILADLDARASTSYVAPMLRSWILAQIGEMEGAFAALEEARAERSAPLGFGIRFPIYDSMRDDARFSELLHRMNLR